MSNIKFKTQRLSLSRNIKKPSQEKSVFTSPVRFLLRIKLKRMNLH